MMSKYIMAVVFGRKTKKLTKFGIKAAKKGIHGIKNGGKLSFLSGTNLHNPKMMGAHNNRNEGIEKITR